MSSQTVENKPAVLIVDDNPLIVNVLRSLLLSEQYAVCTAQNGKEALGLLERNSVDVIICDVMMPKMDGYQFHHQVREKAEYSHIPFVFLTALDHAQEVHRGRETGADEYITKPFDPKNLISVVRGKIVRAKGIKNSTEQRYDGFRKRVIHTLSHEFRTPLVAINTGTEMLLEQLVKEHGHLEAVKVQGLLEAIHRGGQRLERLVTDFMLLQQVEAGIAERLFRDRGKDCDAGALLKTFLDSFEENFKRESFSVTVENMLSEGDGVIHIYEPQILDILKRVASNSLKFKSEHREIKIFCYQQESVVIYEIRDRGIGFDPARLKEAIDTFGQLDRDKLEQQGGGLGLAIASKYAKINNAKLEFAARPGGGAVVSLVIPIKSKASAAGSV